MSNVESGATHFDVRHPSFLIQRSGPMSFPIRSPRDRVNGIAVFGRIVDKIRLQAKEGKLPEKAIISGLCPTIAPLMIGCASC